MGEKRKTAWDGVPKEQRKKTIITGIVMAFVGMAIGLVIATLGIFNPMAGVTTGEPEPDVDIHSVVSWTLPEGGVEKNKDNTTGLMDVDEAYIKFDNGYGNSMYSLYVGTRKEFENDGYTFDGMYKEDRPDGSEIWYYDEEIKETGAICVSPDGDLLLEIGAEFSGPKSFDTDEQFNAWQDECFEQIKAFAENIAWK